ncbi:unnamed protein product [Prorocentrum cordatum]|uniref:Uncharacterized protein n=1 Tax=Prorocentrum cordatum TaxID=2364126 RepID=A0ABN9Q5D4_9DINO|nr:unnamed protein product [Polarella glacialis]
MRSWSPTSSLLQRAGTSACEKGEQWQQALALLSEMREAKLEPNVISCTAGISAYEKGEQWQRALALLSEMREAKLEPIAISSTMQGPARARRRSYSSTQPATALRSSFCCGETIRQASHPQR